MLYIGGLYVHFNLSLALRRCLYQPIVLSRCLPNFLSLSMLQVGAEGGWLKRASPVRGVILPTASTTACVACDLDASIVSLFCPMFSQQSQPNQSEIHWTAEHQNSQLTNQMVGSPL